MQRSQPEGRGKQVQARDSSIDESLLLPKGSKAVCLNRKNTTLHKAFARWEKSAKEEGREEESKSVHVYRLATRCMPKCTYDV